MMYTNIRMIITEGRMMMPNILPVSDLRNYNEVLKNCKAGEPVFLTNMLFLILKIMKERGLKRNC